MSRRLKSFLGLVLGVLLLYYSYLWVRKGERVRRESLPQKIYESLRKLPPELLFTTSLLGGFRGILVDILWLRAMKLKEEARYFELVQLSNWIGLLQPDIPQVWIFNAWNLAYNVSVEFPTPEERWNWIYQGIKLLRDKALLYTPDSPEIYRELAWIYLNKIGSTLDEFNAYYKKKWAEIMQEALGDYRIRDIAEAKEEKEFPDILKNLEKEGIEVLDNPSLLNSKEIEELIPPEKKRREFQLWIRKRYLKERLRLNPDKMLSLEKKYIPFDWRVPGAHALYWIEEGKEKTPMDEITYRRITYFSLNQILRWGRVRISKVEGEDVLLLSPDFRIVPLLNRFYEETLTRVPENIRTGVESSHQNFLRDVILNAYIYNDLDTARKYFAYLRKTYPQVTGNRSLEEFILREYFYVLREGSEEELRSLLYGILYQFYWSYAVGDDNKAFGLERLARLIYRKATSLKRYQGILPPYPELKEAILKRVEQTFPPPLVRALRLRLKGGEKK